MDWKNVNLEDNYERNKNLLENYTFETLLLEVSANLGTRATKESIKRQALESIKAKYNEALQVLEDNLDNITEHALKEINED